MPLPKSFALGALFIFDPEGLVESALWERRDVLAVLSVVLSNVGFLSRVLLETLALASDIRLELDDISANARLRRKNWSNSSFLAMVEFWDAKVNTGST